MLLSVGGRAKSLPASCARHLCARHLLACRHWHPPLAGLVVNYSVEDRKHEVHFQVRRHEAHLSGPTGHVHTFQLSVDT